MDSRVDISVDAHINKDIVYCQNFLKEKTQFYSYSSNKNKNVIYEKRKDVL